MKRYFLTLTALALLLTGCGSREETSEQTLPAEQPALTEVTFSNLADEESRTQMRTVLTEAGISEEQLGVLLNHVDQFNGAVRPEELTTGMETLLVGQTKYDPWEVQDEWMAVSPDFLGYNCRITAFSLFRNFVTVPAGGEVNTDDIFLDLDSLNLDHSAFPGEEDAFAALYSTVPTEHTTDVARQAEIFRKSWSDRGVVFDDREDIRLISVVFHNNLDGDTLTIGHTGILFPREDGLYFLEKLAFQEPYQWVKFRNRTELSDYMMLKYDLNQGQDLAVPFILENDQLLEGYRPTPNK